MAKYIYTLCMTNPCKRFQGTKLPLLINFLNQSKEPATLDRVEIDPETGLLKRETLEYRNGLGKWGRDYAVHTDKLFNVPHRMCKGDEYFTVILDNGRGMFNLGQVIAIAKKNGFKPSKRFNWERFYYTDGIAEIADEAEQYINANLCGEGAAFMCTENGDWVVVNEAYLLNNSI